MPGRRITSGSRRLRAISGQQILGRRLGPGVIVPARDIPVERRALRDGTGPGTGIIGIDRSGVDQPLDLGGEAYLANQPRCSDVVGLIVRPSLGLRVGQVVDEFDPLHGGLEVRPVAVVAAKDLEAISSKFGERRSRAADHRTDTMTGRKKLSDQLLADEARAAKHQDVWFGGWHATICRGLRS